MKYLKSIIFLSMALIFAFGFRSGKSTSNKEVNSLKEVMPHLTNAVSGTLTGKISYAGKVPGRNELKAMKDDAICGLEKHYDQSLLVGKNKGIQNVLVSMTNVTEGIDVKSLGTEFSLRQTGCKFIPHMVIVPVGTPLTIYNDDGILHNIHTFSKKNRPFNLAQPKYRKKLDRKFRRPEIVQVKCDVHSWMNGYIVVVDHPYHSITNEKGEYSIEGIPAGIYQVEYWHEKLGKMKKEVKIGAGASTKLDLVFTEEKK